MKGPHLNRPLVEISGSTLRCPTQGTGGRTTLDTWMQCGLVDGCSVSVQPMSTQDPSSRVRTEGRRLSYVGFAVVVIVYLVIIQVGGIVMKNIAGPSGDTTFTTKGVLISLVLPLAVALAFTYGVVAYLGWWRPVLRDDHPVRRWVIVVPVIIGVAILATINYGALANKGIVYILVLLFATQLVGWGRRGHVPGNRCHGPAQTRPA